jgi:3'-5' exoribonuclease
MMADLMQLCRVTFTHKPWLKFLSAVFKDEEILRRFKTAIGAKNVHHAYAGGLLEHTLSVSELCMRLCDHYPELDRQVLLAGAIFHDIGKAWELSGGIANDYTDEGRLIGHISIGLEKAEPYLLKSGLEPELIMHFKHLVLGHHGTKEWGSPVLPATPEALVLHYADNIDAKLAQVRGLFADFAGDVTGWTPYQTTLGRHMYKPARTPEPETKQAAKREAARDIPKEDQCSLL